MFPLIVKFISNYHKNGLGISENIRRWQKKSPQITTMLLSAKLSFFSSIVVFVLLLVTFVWKRYEGFPIISFSGWLHFSICLSDRSVFIFYFPITLCWLFPFFADLISFTMLFNGLFHWFDPSPAPIFRIFSSGILIVLNWLELFQQS